MHDAGMQGLHAGSVPRDLGWVQVLVRPVLREAPVVRERRSAPVGLQHGSDHAVQREAGAQADRRRVQGDAIAGHEPIVAAGPVAVEPIAPAVGAEPVVAIAVAEPVAEPVSVTVAEPVAIAEPVPAVVIAPVAKPAAKAVRQAPGERAGTAVARELAVKHGAHRAGCTPSMLRAHEILDRAREGGNVSAMTIARALSVLGDY